MTQKKMLNKGYEIYKRNGVIPTVIQIEKNTYGIKSESSKQYYHVTKEDKLYSCECASFQYRKPHSPRTCKHIYALTLALTDTSLYIQDLSNPLDGDLL